MIEESMIDYPGMLVGKFIDNMKAQTLPINCIIFPTGKVCKPMISNELILLNYAKIIDSEKDWSKLTEEELVKETKCISIHRNGNTLSPDRQTPMQRNALYDLKDSRVVR